MKQILTPEYIPGTCNIGNAEISRRYRIGYAGLALTIACIIVIQMMHFADSWRLIIALPVCMMLIGFLQARQKFCFAYGLRGVFSVKGMRMQSPVEEEFRRVDKRMAMSLIGKVLLGTTLFTLLYYFLPV